MRRKTDAPLRGAQRAGEAIFAHQPVIELGPVLDAVNQTLVIDDNKQIIVRLVALSSMGFIDPCSACIAAVQNDLEDAPGLLPVVRSRLFSAL